MFNLLQTSKLILPLLLLGIFSNCTPDQKEVSNVLENKMIDKSNIQSKEATFSSHIQDGQMQKSKTSEIDSNKPIAGSMETSTPGMKSTVSAPEVNTKISRSIQPVRSKTNDSNAASEFVNKQAKKTGWTTTQTVTKSAHTSHSKAIQSSNMNTKSFETSKRLSENKVKDNLVQKVKKPFTSKGKNVKAPVATSIETPKLNTTVKSARDFKSSYEVSSSEAKKLQTEKISTSSLPSSKIAAQNKIKLPTRNRTKSKETSTTKTKRPITNSSIKVASKMPKANNELQETQVFKSKFSTFLNTQEGQSNSYSFEKMQFDPESQRISNYSKSEFIGLAEALKANRDKKIKVFVHTADGKNEVQNKRLSSQRAEQIHLMLTTLGVKRNQIKSDGRGGRSLKNENSNLIEMRIK